MFNLSEKTILVTGATSGIGFRACMELARQGAFVIGTGRDEQRCENARQSILQEIPQAKLAFLVGDLSSQNQTKRLAEESLQLIRETGKGRLDVLVNNAGVFSAKKRFSEDGIELTFAVNHIAPFLLTHCLLPALNASDDARVLTVSSDSHYNTRFDPRRASHPGIYLHIWAYKVSKLSNVLFTVEFNRRNSYQGLCAFAVDPGLVNTEIGAKQNEGLVSFVWRIRQNQGQNPEVPVRTITHLASAELGQQRLVPYWKNSQPKAPSRAALDPNLARRLWEESCRLCGIEDYFSQSIALG